MGVERELADLRERLSKVQELKTRRSAIEKELSQVWVEGGAVLNKPTYIKDDPEGQGAEKAVYETASEGEGAADEQL